jgi:hypothetical protein
MSIRRRKGGRVAGWLGLGMSVSGLCLAFTAVAGNAAAGGNDNKGDVWVDTVGSIAAGPGHEMDPHLPCADINLWGNGLADSTGTFTIDGYPPSDANGSGSKEVDYSAIWKYTVTKGDSMIALINVDTLVDAAIANGDAPKNKQGLHFKLDFGQDPQKHKTFWVNCPADPAPTPGTSTPTPTPGTSTPTPTPTGGTQGLTSTPTPNSTTGTSSTTSPTTTISGGVQGLQTGPAPTPVTGAEMPLGLGSLLVLMGTGMFGLSAARRRNDR